MGVERACDFLWIYDEENTAAINERKKASSTHFAWVCGCSTGGELDVVEKDNKLSKMEARVKSGSLQCRFQKMHKQHATSGKRACVWRRRQGLSRGLGALPVHMGATSQKKRS
jgi:hypothetical protein